MTDRLSLATLAHARQGIVRPAFDPRDVQLGVLHLGIGAFHRAHQAVFTELAAAQTGDLQWGIVGMTQRSATVRDQLVPQDCLYSVLEHSGEFESLRIIGSVRGVIDGASQPSAVIDKMAHQLIRVVTLTVTEKGYRRGAAGELNLADPLVAADVAGGVPRTVIGQLARGLQRRLRDHGAPITILACDNLSENGAVTKHLVQEFVRALAADEQRDLMPWLETSVTFPSCMVDRIVPATTDQDKHDVLSLLGLEDHGAVAAEPFKQWVIEDDFATGRPAWELAGAVFTKDVAPWEAMKLRMLNATHSTLAYLGALRGYETIAAALGDPELATIAGSLMNQDVIPTLTAPDGLALPGYAASVLERFSNAALRHTTAQVAMDGSQKLPLRLIPTIRENLARSVTPHWATLSIAAWMTYVAVGRDVNGRELVLDDPMADELKHVLAGAETPDEIVNSLLGVRAIFGTDLPENSPWRTELRGAVSDLLRQTR